MDLINLILQRYTRGYFRSKEALLRYLWFKQITSFYKNPIEKLPSFLIWIFQHSMYLNGKSDIQKSWTKILENIDTYDTEGFWRDYAFLTRHLQPIAIKLYDQHIGLREGDCFYTDTKNSYFWLQSDITQWRIPFMDVWHWIQKSSSTNFEATYLLASFSAKAFKKHIVPTLHTKDITYEHTAVVMAMLFKISLDDRFHKEQSEWRDLLLAWSPEQRLVLLELSSIVLTRQIVQNYIVQWAPLLYPEACPALVIGEGLNELPSKMLKLWYESKSVANIEDPISINDLLVQ